VLDGPGQHRAHRVTQRVHWCGRGSSKSSRPSAGCVRDHAAPASSGSMFPTNAMRCLATTSASWTTPLGKLLRPGSSARSARGSSGGDVPARRRTAVPPPRHRNPPRPPTGTPPVGQTLPRNRPSRRRQPGKGRVGRDPWDLATSSPCGRPVHQGDTRDGEPSPLADRAAPPPAITCRQARAARASRCVPAWAWSHGDLHAQGPGDPA